MFYFAVFLVFKQGYGTVLCSVLQFALCLSYQIVLRLLSKGHLGLQTCVCFFQAWFEPDMGPL